MTEENYEQKWKESYYALSVALSRIDFLENLIMCARELAEPQSACRNLLFDHSRKFPMGRDY